MKLNIHARMELAALALMLLGSCEPLKSKNDIDATLADANSKIALRRLDILESEVQDLRQKVKLNSVNIDALFDNGKGYRKTLNGNADAYNEFRNRTDTRITKIEQRLGMNSLQ